MKTILLIEDDLTIRELMVEFLQEEGYRVVIAGNGFDGLKFLSENPQPCLVLLDSQMPLLNGPEFMEHFNTLPEEQRQAPVYLFSADNAIDYKSLGCKGFLKKPIDFAKLRQVLKECE